MQKSIIRMSLLPTLSEMSQEELKNNILCENLHNHNVLRSWEGGGGIWLLWPFRLDLPIIAIALQV